MVVLGDPLPSDGAGDGVVAHDVVVGTANWHQALTLSSEDRQSQPVPDCRDELSLPQVLAHLKIIGTLTCVVILSTNAHTFQLALDVIELTGLKAGV